MIQHLFKLVWNRRKGNLLTTIQIFAAFLVLALLLTQAVHYWNNYRQPLCFDYKNVWGVAIDTKSSVFVWNKENEEKLERLYREINSFPEVKGVAGSMMLPFLNWNWTSGDSTIGKFVVVEREFVTDDYASVMNLTLTQGEWFNASHNAANFTPAVINERLAKAYFGDENPIGKRIFPRFPKGDEKNLTRDNAVVVIEDTGDGISDVVRQNLFTPFFSTKENGQGLGLALVQEILTNHGFEFSLTSSERQTTEFKITFNHSDRNMAA